MCEDIERGVGPYRELDTVRNGPLPVSRYLLLHITPCPCRKRLLICLSVVMQSCAAGFKFEASVQGSLVIFWFCNQVPPCCQVKRGRYLFAGHALLDALCIDIQKRLGNIVEHRCAGLPTYEYNMQERMMLNIERWLLWKMSYLGM